MDFPRSSVGKESACKAEDLGLIPGLGGFPGEGNGNPLQYSCLEKPMDRGAWRATVQGVTRADEICQPPLLMKVKVAQLHPTLQPHGLCPTGLFSP